MNEPACAAPFCVEGIPPGFAGRKVVYLPAAPQAVGISEGSPDVPQAVGASVDLPAAPQAVGASTGLPAAPQAVGTSEGLSAAPQAVPQDGEAMIRLQDARLESAINSSSLMDLPSFRGQLQYSRRETLRKVRTFILGRHLFVTLEAA